MFEQICHKQALFEAYYRARKGLKDKTAANMFSERLEISLQDLRDQLLNDQYTFGPYKLFKVRDPKEREIYAAPFVDRIVHHAINAQIEPIFDRSFIEHTYACRRGKGNLEALKKLQSWINGMPNTYILKMDIKKYFASIDRHILVDMIARKICDQKTLRLIEQLIYNAPIEMHRGKGLPIGNLTSQTFANLYLSQLDHFLKDKLGVKHYLRYVDDFVVFGDKRTIHDLLRTIVDFLHLRLQLEVDPTKQKILHIKNGLPFLGFVLRSNRQPRLQHQAVKRFVSRIKRAREEHCPEPDLAEQVLSWFGYAKLAKVDQILVKTDTFKYVEMML